MRHGYKPYKCISGAQREDTAMVRGVCKAQEGGTLTISDGSRFPINLIQFNRDKERLHPTQKPIELIQYLIRTYTNEGELVLDNCMGSGTTAIAAMREHRHFIGFELNKEYYDKACERIGNEQLTLFN